MVQEIQQSHYFGCPLLPPKDTAVLYGELKHREATMALDLDGLKQIKINLSLEALSWQPSALSSGRPLVRQ